MAGYGFGYGCYVMNNNWYNAAFPGCQQPGGPLVIGGRYARVPRVPITLGNVPLSRAELRGDGGCCQGPKAPAIRYNAVNGYYQPGTSRTAPNGIAYGPIMYSGDYQSA